MSLKILAFIVDCGSERWQLNDGENRIDQETLYTYSNQIDKLSHKGIFLVCKSNVDGHRIVIVNFVSSITRSGKTFINA